MHLNTTDQSRIYLTAHAWFMNCWMLVGRRWRNRRQRPLVLNICKFHEKTQWVTVTLPDNSVKDNTRSRSSTRSAILLALDCRPAETRLIHSARHIRQFMKFFFRNSKTEEQRLNNAQAPSYSREQKRNTYFAGNFINYPVKIMTSAKNWSGGPKPDQPDWVAPSALTQLTFLLLYHNYVVTT